MMPRSVFQAVWISCRFSINFIDVKFTQMRKIFVAVLQVLRVIEYSLSIELYVADKAACISDGDNEQFFQRHFSIWKARREP